jgi:ribosome biogenesis GTPase
VQAALLSGALSRERHESWLKLQRELRAIAMRTDARLRREEKRKWQQRARDGRSRARHRD